MAVKFTAAEIKHTDEAVKTVSEFVAEHQPAPGEVRPEDDKAWKLHHATEWLRMVADRLLEVEVTVKG